MRAEQESCIELWPFLVTRGYRVPFRAVVVPGLSLRNGQRMETILHDAAGGEPTPPGGLLCRYVIQQNAESVVLLHRVVAAKGRKAGKGKAGKLYDEHSRSVPLIEGVVRVVSPEEARGGYDSPPSLPHGAMDEVHAQVQEVFEEFWRADRRDFPVVRSAPLRYPLDARPAAVNWTLLPPFETPLRRKSAPSLSGRDDSVSGAAGEAPGGGSALGDGGDVEGPPGAGVSPVRRLALRAGDLVKEVVSGMRAASRNRPDRGDDR